MNYQTVEETYKYITPEIAGGDILEFGVFNGSSIRRIVNGFKQNNVLFRKFYGYDSFTGLPKEAEGIWENPEWTEGAFNVQNDYGLKSVDEAIAFVYDRTKDVIGLDQLTLIPGFFSESLKEPTDAKNVGYIHIDSDLYVSSMEALDFCFGNGIVAERAIIRFDDIASTPTNAGQHLAWKLAQVKYKIIAEQLSYNVFKVVNYEGLEQKIIVKTTTTGSGWDKHGINIRIGYQALNEDELHELYDLQSYYSYISLDFIIEKIGETGAILITDNKIISEDRLKELGIL